jgi:N-acetylglucosamine-6-phosphate deacetylase
VHDGEIVAVGLPGRGAGIAAPGLVDTQVNGYAGVDVLDAEPDALLAMGKALLRDGVLAYVPTLITSELGRLRRAAQRIADTTKATGGNSGGAAILGIHLEGPFLSPARPGTHPVERLRAPDTALLEELLDFGDIRVMTLAPELEGALALVVACRRRGVVVSLGHSAADASHAAAGFAAGATAVTHLYNAMEPLLARAPGLAGTALATDGVTVQVIADGVHVAGEMIRLAFQAARGRCSLVSDTIAAAGIGDCEVRLGEVVVVVKDGVARRADGTLAGSVGKLRDGLVRIRRLGIAPLDALDAVTSRPARLVGSSRYGELAVGGPADLLVLDDELAIERVVVGGREIDLDQP